MNNRDTIEAGASVDNVIDYTISGVFDNTYKLFSCGKLSDNDPSIIYTAEEETSIESITMVNTHTSDVTINLYVDLLNVGSPIHITPKNITLLAGYSLHFSGERLSVLNTKGESLKAESTAIIGNAVDIATSDEGHLFEATEVESALQENRAVINSFISESANLLEVIINNNVIATEVDTANTPIALTLKATTEGVALGNWNMLPGSSGAISVYADYSGTVSSAVLITSTGHGLSTGDIVSIRGTTSYNGVFIITKVNDNAFYIISAWVSDDGASNWEQGDRAVVGEGSAGRYQLTSAFSLSEGGAAGSVALIHQYVNDKPIEKATTERKFANNDVGAVPMSGILDLNIGDIIFLAIESTGTNDITIKRMNLVLDRK